MIRVEVEKYCDNCNQFDPDVSYPVNAYSGSEVYMTTDTVIRCKDRKRCERLKHHIKKEMEARGND